MNIAALLTLSGRIQGVALSSTKPAEEFPALGDLEGFNRFLTFYLQSFTSCRIPSRDKPPVSKRILNQVFVSLSLSPLPRSHFSLPNELLPGRRFDFRKPSPVPALPIRRDIELWTVWTFAIWVLESMSRLCS